MLRGIHKATSNWLGKAIMAGVMGLLVISFAIWGIGDIFRGFGLSSAIKIGHTEISVDQFRQIYNERLQQLGRRLGRSISPDQARALGLDRQVLSQLVAETVLDEQAKALRLGISNQEIADRITNDPSFKGLNGQFDRLRFEQIIRNAGYTESRFVEEQRRGMLRRQIALTIGGDIRVPNVTLNAINQYQNEKRSIQYLALGPAQAGDIPAPTPDQLRSYFEERKALFRAPEYRKFTLLSMSPADLAKPDSVSDAEAKTYYEQHKTSYGTPEKREVHQIVFPKSEDAAAAHDRISKGASFADIVKERGLKQSDTDLGTVAKSDIIDPAVAAAAFSIKPDEVSEPVKGQFGTVLLLVSKIEPGSQKSYEEVAQQIKREIAEGRALSEIGALRDKLEDERAAGSTLAEAAKKLGLTAHTYDAVDRSGRGLDGKPIADLPKTPDVTAAVFNSNVGVDNDPLQLPNGGYLWYDVAGITPSRERTLDEVKDEVTTRWRDDEISKRLQAKSDELLGKAKGGAALNQLASENGLQVSTAADLQRGKPGGFMAAQVVADVFKTPKDGIGAAAGDQDTQHFVFRVTDVVDPPLDPITSKQLTSSVQSAYSDDLVGSYIARLQTELGVTFNQQAIDQIFGGGVPNTNVPGDY
jgi:peptidyl-prolyl cis-trans isomerase D